MVMLNKLVDVIAINNYMLNSHKCISLIYVRFIFIFISALFVVSDFLSAEVSPEIMEVKINPGFRIQKKCPFPLK